MNFDHQSFLETLTSRPGIYKMIGIQGRVLYVGKARHLKNRVASYFRSVSQLDAKTRAMIQQVQQIDVTITPTENEALILESTLIKSLRPPYNILLKDDKSYPYLLLSTHADFPRLYPYRGKQREKGESFGPYLSTRSVHETLDLLQKLFKLRQCSDTFFKNRTRPCLQYQLKRCTAPCVGYIDSRYYRENVELVRLFLQGKNDDVMKALAAKMEKSALELAFEQAAHYRDQIKNLRVIQERQGVQSRVGDLDMLASVSKLGVVCIEVLSIRHGTWIGGQAYFPQAPQSASQEEVLAAFLSQYYSSAVRGKSLPARIYIPYLLPEKTWLETALSAHWGRKTSIVIPRRAEPKKWLQVAQVNAQHALEAYLFSQMQYATALQAFQEVFQLREALQRLECFDISHLQGEATFASCVVFGQRGPLKDSYRRFRIKGVTAGDDYAAIQQALTRHYTHLKLQSCPLPDVLIIDGGKGQLARAKAVLKELQITGVLLLAIAKGSTRKAGLETIFVAGVDHPLSLAADSPALHLLQRLRDEAHRFAITGHRQRLAKDRGISRLEEIPGIGPKRRAQILRFFGGRQGVLNASVQDLAKVPGINAALAERLYEGLHGQVTAHNKDSVN